MNTKALSLGLAILLSATPAVAEQPLPCQDLTGEVRRVFQGIGPSVNKLRSGSIKAKRGALIVDEERELITDWFKPDGGVGGVVPYKQPQLVFSRYLIDGQERFCSTQRHEDVFGAGELRQQYGLRCILDKDEDGRYESFHRYAELVRYDPYSGKTGEPTGTLQSDQALAQPLKLVAAAPRSSAATQFESILRSVIQVIGVTRDSVTIRSADRMVTAAFSESGQPVDDRALPTDSVVPLMDGMDAAIGQTRIYVARRSGWEISAPNGLGDKAELICGGTVLQTLRSWIIFGAGGSAIFPADRSA